MMLKILNKTLGYFYLSRVVKQYALDDGGERRVAYTCSRDRAFPVRLLAVSLVDKHPGSSMWLGIRRGSGERDRLSTSSIAKSQMTFLVLTR